MKQKDLNQVPELVKELIKNQKWDFYKTCYIEQELCKKQTPDMEIVKILFVSKAEAINILRVYYNTFNDFFTDDERVYFVKLNAINDECGETAEKYERIGAVMGRYYLYLDSHFDEIFTSDNLFVE